MLREGPNICLQRECSTKPAHGHDNLHPDICRQMRSPRFRLPRGLVVGKVAHNRTSGLSSTKVSSRRD